MRSLALPVVLLALSPAAGLRAQELAALGEGGATYAAPPVPTGVPVAQEAQAAATTPTFKVLEYACYGTQPQRVTASPKCRNPQDWLDLAQKNCEGKCGKAKMTDGTVRRRCGLREFRLLRRCQ